MANEARIADGSLDFSQGVDTNKATTVASPIANPNGVLRTQLCWGNNITVRGNGIMPRPGYSFLCEIPANIAGSGAPYQGGWLYEPTLGNPYLMLSIGGRIVQVRVDLDNSVKDVTGTSANPAKVPQAYFAQAEQFLVIQAGDWAVNNTGTLPLFWDGTKMFRSVGIIGPNNTPTGGSKPYNQIPPALAMVYYQGRLWYSNGRKFVAGDIVGGTAGSVAYNFADAVLEVTENPLALGGDGFTVPSQAGPITALNFTASLDQTLGQGPLYIFTRKQIYQLVVPVTRTLWIAATSNNQPQQTLAQKKYGANSDRCVFAVNGDLFYGSPEPGVRSLILATRYFQQWANVPISRNVQRAFKFTNSTLLGSQTGIEFDNRALVGVLPVVTNVGIAYQGLVALDFDLISTIAQKLPPAWEGMWEGLDILQLFEGDFGGFQRAFAVCHSRNDGNIQVWEIVKGQLTDNGDNRIQWRMEFPAYTFGDEFKLKKLDGGELWVDKISGTVEMLFEYRVDADACWRPWMETQFCSARSSCETVDNPICYPIQPFCEGQKFPITLPAPNPGDGVVGNLRPGNIGYQFQLRLTVLGSCRVRGLLIYALPHDRRPFEGLVNSSTPIEPSPQQFPNTAQSCTVKCPDGSPFTFTTQPGMFFSITQAAADQQASQYACQQANLRNICLTGLITPIGIRFATSGTASGNLYVGFQFEATITATGNQLAIGAEKNQWSVTGSVPSSLVFTGLGLSSSAQINLAGTPQATDVGHWNFTVHFQDPQGNIASKNYSFTVILGATTFITQSWNTPPVGQITDPLNQPIVADASWMVNGQIVQVDGFGLYTIVSHSLGGLVTIGNPGGSGNAPAFSTVPIGTFVHAVAPL